MRIIHLGNIAPCHYEKGELGSEPVLTAEQPAFETVTEIRVSDDSDLAQALKEVVTIWGVHSHNDVPEWIGHSADAKSLAILLADHFKIEDIREMQP